MSKEKLRDRARDELFSHINRCGVLQASEEDQKVWMDETIDYVAERYPDLGDADLDELHAVGLRFCRPAIPHGAEKDSASGQDAGEDEVEEAEDIKSAEEMHETEDANAA